ncbi:uncharacterized protein LOC120216348 isoform X2 [Hibiscus syriacus]|uniref:uncharacterized protein LOC120216348 isoform X2 n=1 Tax=Hibiscus syriacus TaxID=106335 RepID=UPI0019219ADE|nr:uncharacterized protein LOC120216348 isoform X2 [Hibiscus syriacus]
METTATKDQSLTLGCPMETLHAKDEARGFFDDETSTNRVLHSGDSLPSLSNPTAANLSPFTGKHLKLSNPDTGDAMLRCQGTGEDKAWAMVMGTSVLADRYGRQ